MMVVDTSVLIAILMNEPGCDVLAKTVVNDAHPILPSPAYLETSMVYGARKGQAGLRELDQLIADLGLTITDFSAKDARTARDAFMTYGKGRHPAGLNFGDCMSYALAKAGGWPLLYAGGDFALADVG